MHLKLISLLSITKTLNYSIQKPMALKHKTIAYLLSILFFVSFHVANGVPPETICGSTVNPTYCKNVFANQNGNIYDYGKISIQKSLSQSRKFMNSIDSQLQGGSSLSSPSAKWTIQFHHSSRSN